MVRQGVLRKFPNTKERLRMRTQRMTTAAAMAIAAMLMAGCMIKTDKHGDSDNVTISTPFGGMQVKTNNEVALQNLGIAVYPGAQPAKKDNDDGAADVNMNFGGYQLRVKAATYRTSDAPDKVETFYRNELKRYGDVIACHDHGAIGTPVKTLEGLTCDEKVKSHVNVDSHPGEYGMELKAGSKLHQHIAGIDPDGSGTKFELVALDLPRESTDDGQP
jgi:hypothetical protein